MHSTSFFVCLLNACFYMSTHCVVRLHVDHFVVNGETLSCDHVAFTLDLQLMWEIIKKCKAKRIVYSQVAIISQEVRIIIFLKCLICSDVARETRFGCRVCCGKVYCYPHTPSFRIPYRRAAFIDLHNEGIPTRSLRCSVLYVGMYSACCLMC